MHVALRRIVDVTVVLMLIGAVVVIVIEFTKPDDDKNTTTTPKPSYDPLPDKDPNGDDVPTYDEIVADLGGPDELDLTWLKWTGVVVLILICLLGVYFVGLPKWRRYRERLREIENYRGMTEAEKRVAKQASYMKAAKSPAGGSQMFIEAAIREAFDVGKDPKRSKEAHTEIDRLFTINPLKTAAAMALAMDKEAVTKAGKIAEMVNEQKRGKEIEKFLKKHGVMGDKIMKQTLYERSLREG
jgi:hypothetical protein